MQKLFFLLALFLGLFFLAAPAYAETKSFDISTNSTYTVATSGITTVSQRVNITNTTEYYYTPSYSINIGMENVENVKVFNSDGNIPFTTQDVDDGKLINIKFDKKIVGLNKVNSFTFSFTSNEIAKKQGSVWEINIPGIADPENFIRYDTTLIVPKSFGVASIVKPSINILTSGNEFSFTKSETARSGVFIIFGDAQYYDLKLTYHLENKNLFPVTTEIALPPTTSYQDVIIRNINPKPTNVYIDDDGNWLAKYNMPARKIMTIVTNVYIKVDSAPISAENLRHEDLYTRSQTYWDVSSENVKVLAKRLKTPRAIYDYVVDKLSYNYNKVAKDNIRLGAKKVLDTPTNAVCLEFTDLFVSIARAAGIPSRAVEGYAFTSNNKLRPLSLVKDILHAWPEYYDVESKTWRMVDPTWENTTMGMDYYDSLDFDHIVFAIKGKSSVYPVPAGGYKIDENSQDVEVSFLDPEKFVPTTKFEIKSDFPKFAISGVNVKGSFTLVNTGNSLLSSQKINVNSEFVSGDQKYATSAIPPFGSESGEVNLGKTKLLTNKGYKVKIETQNASLESLVFVGILPNYAWMLIGGVIIFGIILVPIAIKTRSILLQRRKEEDPLRGESQRPQKKS